MKMKKYTSKYTMDTSKNHNKMRSILNPIIAKIIHFKIRTLL